MASPGQRRLDPGPSRRRGAAVLAAGGLTALTGWFALLAAGTALLLPPQVLAIGPRDAILTAALAGNGRLAFVGPVRAGWGSVALANASRADIAALYAAGAILVIPARTGGCGLGTAALR